MQIGARGSASSREPSANLGQANPDLERSGLVQSVGSGQRLSFQLEPSGSGRIGSGLSDLEQIDSAPSEDLDLRQKWSCRMRTSDWEPTGSGLSEGWNQMSCHLRAQSDLDLTVSD